MGNGYSLDCKPIGSGSCSFPDGSVDDVQAAVAPPPPPLSGPEYGFYCYNPWAFCECFASGALSSCNPGPIPFLTSTVGLFRHGHVEPSAHQQRYVILTGL